MNENDMVQDPENYVCPDCVRLCQEKDKLIAALKEVTWTDNLDRAIWYATEALSELEAKKTREP